MKQASLIVKEKIRGDFQRNYPNIAREIKNIVASQSETYVELHNGSKITIVPASDGGRGMRSTLNIYEEFRLIKKEVLDSVLSPFLISRQAPYLKNPEYSHLIEEPKEIYISSAWFRFEWIWDELKKVTKSHLRGEPAGVIAFDYLTAIAHGLKSKKQMQKERMKSDEVTFMMEYENIMFGENENAYFKFDMLKKNRTIKRAFYPFRNDQLNLKKNPNDIKRIDGEVRILCADIATRKGKENDNSILGCIRLLPTTKGYEREVSYMESHQGENTVSQALRIKQLYNDFNADYIVLDLQNVGAAVFDILGTVTRDDERGIEYEAFTVFPHKSLDKGLIEELQERTLAVNAKPVIYPIRATAELNNDIAVDFRDKLQRGHISFLIDENEGEDFLSAKRGTEFTDDMDINLKVWYLQPYRQTTEFVNETVNLEYKILNGKVKLEEPRSGRKDRYTSISYGSYFASLLEQELLKEHEEFDFKDFMMLSGDSSGGGWAGFDVFK